MRVSEDKVRLWIEAEAEALGTQEFGSFEDFRAAGDLLLQSYARLPEDEFGPWLGLGVTHLNKVYTDLLGKRALEFKLSQAEKQRLEEANKNRELQAEQFAAAKKLEEAEAQKVQMSKMHAEAMEDERKRLEQMAADAEKRHRDDTARLQADIETMKKNGCGEQADMLQMMKAMHQQSAEAATKSQEAQMQLVMTMMENSRNDMVNMMKMQSEAAANNLKVITQLANRPTEKSGGICVIS